MLFNSPEFIAFLIATIVIFFAIGRLSHRGALGWLAAASLFFYAWWNPLYLPLLLGSIGFNFIIGKNLAKTGSKRLLTTGVVANLLAIGYFKYANFFLTIGTSLLGSSHSALSIILPLAISFYTFQQIAYLVDCYKARTSEGSFLDYLLFVTVFPALIAGPIIHHKELLPQLKRPEIFSPQRTSVAAGASIFLLGLFKKAVIADGFAPYANAVFDHADAGGSITFFEGWAGALAYSLQLYNDFSGYSDMAIGAGLMINISLPMNFASPYRQTSIIDFWRTWHMTLSRFLRDHVYIPLGGGRRGPVKRYRNLMTTMLVGGLWHGASWTFVLWGGLHGLFLLINHGWRHLAETTSPLRRLRNSRMFPAFAWLLTFVPVVVAWVFFRAKTFDGALAILSGMTGRDGFVLPTQLVALVPFSPQTEWLQAKATMPLLGGGTLMGVVEEFAFLFAFGAVAVFAKNLHQISDGRRLVLLGLTFALAVQSVFFSLAPSEFLYFQF